MKLKRALVCLVLVLTGLTLTPKSASAYLTVCNTNGLRTSTGNSWCASHVNNGGLNQQRVHVFCSTDSPAGVWHWGPWKNENYISSYHCANTANGYPGYVSIVDYELR